MVLSRLSRHWSGIPGLLGQWELSTIKKIMGLEKKQKASKVVKCETD